MPRVPLAGRDDLDSINLIVNDENRSAASGSGGDDDDDDDTGPRLVIVSHAFSRAQQEYVEARHKDNPNAPIFYKDATPRGEHYVRCGVQVSGVNHGLTVPARLEVCFCDGVSVNSKFVTRPGKPETEALKILGDGDKYFEIEPGKTKYFDYRIEVGSLRADDRKFCVKVVPNADHVAGVLPAVTPGLLVLSKKRLTGEGPAEGDPVRKRRKAAAPPPVPSIAYEPLPPQPSPYALPVIPPAALPVVPPAALPVIAPPRLYTASDVLSQTLEILARVGALETQVQHCAVTKRRGAFFFVRGVERACP
mmetsp:Transcript_27933/g.86696  ORF Transcript_27933/g.86696 Transcript_27933/m.86696 type:complete len:307 (+) Transcript_27933:273-1193(+)